MTIADNPYLDSNRVYRSLGTFWLRIFQEQKFLRGHALGEAQELAQKYLDLVAALDTYSVQKVPVFDTVLWQPITVFESAFGKEPFVFETDGAVFGSQSPSDPFYPGVTFEFGEPKTLKSGTYTFQLPDGIAEIKMLANNIINPTAAWFVGGDLFVRGRTVYVNQDIFANPDVPKAQIVDAKGEVIDRTVTLWAYRAEINRDTLFKAYGYIFDVNLPNNRFFKDLLGRIVALYSGGPTVENIIRAASILAGQDVALHNFEKVEDVATSGGQKIVVTNREVYQVGGNERVIVIPGQELMAGEAITAGCQYYDYVTSPGWWRNALLGLPIGFENYVFLGNFRQSLYFNNSFMPFARVDDGTPDGRLEFPVIGDAEDVAEFNLRLNQQAQKEGYWFDLEKGDSQIINPVDFVMSNLLRANTACMTFKFSSTELGSRFLRYFPLVREHFPKHIYFIVPVSIEIDGETVTIGYKQTGGTDGSNNQSGTSTVVRSIADQKPFGSTRFDVHMSPDRLADQFYANHVKVGDPNAGDPGKHSLVTDGDNGWLVPGGTVATLQPIPSGATTKTYRRLVILPGPSAVAPPDRP